MSDPFLVLDNGNSGAKAKMATVEKFIPHAIYRLTYEEYDQVLRDSFDDPPEDYLMVDGVAYVVGESANSYRLVKRKGQARYTRDYYGVMLCAVLARIYGHSEKGIHLFASHPPAHVNYVGDIQQAAGGEWEVEWKGRSMQFKVDYVSCFPEAAGGMYHVAFNETGSGYLHEDVIRQRTLVLDVGEGTFDIMAFANGRPDYAIRDSQEIGIGDALRAFEKSARSRYRSQLKSAITIHPSILRNGLTTGWLDISGGRLDCSQEADSSVNQLLNRIADAYQQIAGGGINYQNIILTGGGSAMLGDRLGGVLNHQNMWWAEDMELMHFANARGGWKFLNALRMKGKI